MSRSQAGVLAALACILLAAGCSSAPQPQSGTDMRSKQERTLDQPDGMKGGGGSGGSGGGGM
jgi:outer membrane biogenesis lipoprotein LolB